MSKIEFPNGAVIYIDESQYLEGMDTAALLATMAQASAGKIILICGDIMDDKSLSECGVTPDVKLDLKKLKESSATNIPFDSYQPEKQEMRWGIFKMKCGSCKKNYIVKNINSIYMTKCMKCGSGKVKQV